jgi:hypothetical protein
MNFETTEPIIDIHRVNKQVRHTRGWAGKCKNTTTWFVFIPLGRLWSLVGPVVLWRR